MMLPEIGEALRSARKASKRTQAEVAAALGMSRATISAIENGTVNEIGVRNSSRSRSAWDWNCQ